MEDTFTYRDRYVKIRLYAQFMAIEMQYISIIVTATYTYTILYHNINIIISWKHTNILEVDFVFLSKTTDCTTNILSR